MYIICKLLRIQQKQSQTQQTPLDSACYTCQEASTQVTPDYMYMHKVIIREYNNLSPGVNTY